MAGKISSAAADVARVAIRRGVVLSDLRGPASEWTRARLMEAVGGTSLDEVEWSQVMRELASATERAAKAQASTASICRACGQAVRWVETVNGRRMPIDPLPTPAGNVVLRPAGRKVLAFVHGNHELPLPRDVQAYRAHAATCPRWGSRKSKPDRDSTRPRCAVCGLLMDQHMWDLGERTHPTCGGD